MRFALLFVLLGTKASGQPPQATTLVDPSSVNVCERVPGAYVAKALGKVLRSEKPIVDKESKLSRCVYVLGSATKPGDPTDGLVLWLYAPGDYDELKSVTEAKTVAVPDLGDEAIRFLDPGDRRHKVRLLRRGRFALETTAADQAAALALAKLALARFDR